MYVATIAKDTETKSNTTVREVKKIATYNRLVTQSCGVQQSKRSREEPKSSGKARASKKHKYEIDVTLKSSKIEGTFEIVSPLTLKDLIDEICKDGNLNNVSTYNENFDDKDQREVREAIAEYIDIYIKALLELASMISKGLYDILDVRRHTSILEDDRIKECLLVNLSFVISRNEVTRLLKLAKDRF